MKRPAPRPRSGAHVTPRIKVSATEFASFEALQEQTRALMVRQGLQPTGEPPLTRAWAEPVRVTIGDNIFEFDDLEITIGGVVLRPYDDEDLSDYSLTAHI